jgi:ketosteroid isomerase-like protein
MQNEELIEKTAKHFEAVKGKLIDEILGFYQSSEDLLVFVEGPRWRTIGYENVAKGWRDFADSKITVKDCNWVECLESRAAGGMGFVAGISELNVEIEGKEQIIRFRGTFIFEKDSAGNWKVIHEHFSQPAADPYGIGDWLKKD